MGFSNAGECDAPSRGIESPGKPENAELLKGFANMKNRTLGPPQNLVDLKYVLGVYLLKTRESLNGWLRNAWFNFAISGPRARVLVGSPGLWARVLVAHGSSGAGPRGSRVCTH